MKVFAFLVVATYCLVEICTAMENPYVAIKDKINANDLDAVPFGPNGEAVNAEFSFHVINVADANPNKKEVEIDAWLALKWNTAFTWAKEEVHGVSSMPFAREHFWTPDLSLFNGIGKISVDAPDMVVLLHNGTVLYVPKTRLRAPCDVDAHKMSTNITCSFVFGLWASYDGVAKIVDDKDGVVFTDHYFEGSKYELIGHSHESQALEFGEFKYSLITVNLSFKERIPSPVMNGFVQGMFAMH